VSLVWPAGWERIEAAVLARSTSLDSDLHGPAHWRAVGRVGVELARRTPGADLGLVLLFALLHDSQRWHDGTDPGHGPRAADLARKLHRGRILDLAPDRLDLLRLTCARHADGGTSADPTVGACWDADRLNLWRCGITPTRRLLSTAAARSPDLYDWSRGVHDAAPGWEDVAAAAASAPGFATALAPPRQDVIVGRQGQGRRGR
jgi:uncharacterized protein